MFEALVDLTDPICRKINVKKADYLVYDTTGIELPVAENNPKFFNTKLKAAKNWPRAILTTILTGAFTASCPMLPVQTRMPVSSI